MGRSTLRRRWWQPQKKKLHLPPAQQYVFVAVTLRSASVKAQSISTSLHILATLTGRTVTRNLMSEQILPLRLAHLPLQARPLRCAFAAATARVAIGRARSTAACSPILATLTGLNLASQMYVV